MALFELRGLSFTYPEQSRPALENIDLTVQTGAFHVLCGASGCGKTTLLRQLKPALTPHGRRTGRILFDAEPLEQLSPRRQAAQIGFVLQSPENQAVTDKVWHELAFGLESLGYDTPEIRRRVAEMASFFGMEDWFYRDVASLSGGQKQLLNLASVMALQPKVLVLDEPTSQLDPIAASEFLSTLGRINRELGTTVILTEHRLEEAFALATDVTVLDNGRVLCTDTPAQVGVRLKEAGHGMFLAMPTPMRVWAAAETDAPCPVTVRDGREFLSDYFQTHSMQPLPPEPSFVRGQTPALEAEDVWFRYEKDSPHVVKGLSVCVYPGEFLAILGGNGTGKTTTLRLLAGLRKPCRGAVRQKGRVAMLPQNPQSLFVKKTVLEDLREVFCGKPDGAQTALLEKVVALCRLEALLGRHPFDLSGGEQQRAALAKVLLTRPDILLLDEPTKGLDAEFKQSFAAMIRQLTGEGVAVLMVSHDVEFCAQYAHRCALFFDGSLVTQGTPRSFFSGNSFYTTAANRMARQWQPQTVTAQDAAALCGASLPRTETPPPQAEVPPTAKTASREKKLPRWRKCLAALAAVAAVVLFFCIAKTADLSELLHGGMAALCIPQAALYLGLIAALFVFALAVSRRAAPPAALPVSKGKLPKRTVAAIVLILVLIPATLYFGLRYLSGRKYYITALLVLLECMLPFFLSFEERKPQARELVLLAVLCAIGVAGRAVFFMLPQFKPVLALTIVAGVALGAESGFLVGAMTMLLSNMLFSQGPWTPWQMFSMGLAGFLAGILFRKGLLRRSRWSLCIFGALSAILIYGGIMNAASLLMWSDEVSWSLLLPYYISGFPVDCVHAAATVFFLWLAGLPMLEKLDRIKVKYGLVEPDGSSG